jgi:glycosyltransferase involved in cell wall biosynthesis
LVSLDADGSTRSTLAAVRRLRQYLRDHPLDLLHIHGSGTLILAQLAMLGMRKRPTVWFTWHNSEEVLDGTGWRSRLGRWALNRCDRLFGSSRSVAKKLQPLAPKLPCSVFTNGVPEIPPTEGLDADPPLIVWAARLTPTKSPELLLRSLAQLKDEGYNFRAVLAGGAPPHLADYALDLREKVEQWGLADRVEMPDWVEDMAALYRKAAIGVQTSRTEGLSMTLLEQMMAGLAIVATNVGDTAEAIEHEKTGLLVQSGDVDALTVAIRQLLDNPDQRIEFAEAARRTALETFSLDAMAQQVLQAFENASDEAAQPAMPAEASQRLASSA